MSSGAASSSRVDDGHSDIRSIAPPSAERSGQLIEALHAVAQLVAREPDSDTLFLELAPVLANAMRTRFAAVTPLVEHSVGAMVTSGPVPADANEALLRALAWVAQRRQRIVLSDPTDVLPGTEVPLSALGWHDVLLAPVLHHAGHATAALCVANRSDGQPFEPTDVRLFETIAEQVVVGIDRAQLFGRLDEWSRTLEALLSFSATVHRQSEPGTLVNEVIEHAARFLKADGARAGLLVSGHVPPTLRSSAYWQAGAWYRGVREFSTHDGIPGRVLDAEFPYLTAEYASDAYADRALSAQALVQHAIAVPIKDNTGAVIGFFELHRAPGRPAFTWNDAAFLESLADTTAMAIENARLVTELALRNYEIRQLFARHAERLEEERQHIARELHDEAGQALVGVKLALQTLSRVVPDGLQTIRSPLDELRQQVNQATARLRQLARRLRPPALDQHGLPSALSQLVHDTEERAGLEVALDLRWLPDRRSPVLETALFRITQEALTNIVAHANARRVSIQLGECSGSMWLQITDDGRGFQTGTDTGGLGLRGIAERVHVLGGDFQLHSAPAEGTRLCVRLPVG